MAAQPLDQETMLRQVSVEELMQAQLHNLFWEQIRLQLNGGKGLPFEFDSNGVFIRRGNLKSQVVIPTSLRVRAPPPAAAPQGVGEPDMVEHPHSEEEPIHGTSEGIQQVSDGSRPVPDGKQPPSEGAKPLKNSPVMRANAQESGGEDRTSNEEDCEVKVHGEERARCLKSPRRAGGQNNSDIAQPNSYARGFADLPLSYTADRDGERRI